AENRRIEPWTQSVLYYLNHPLRQQEAVKYIVPALELLPEIQRTGDIFFPGNWCYNLLCNHRSKEAYETVKLFLESHSDYPTLLLNKVFYAKFMLDRANQAK
ncbi:MAG: aminopeptidase, partial [Paludibacteraceae bacterium]|nr:aminopeptidase [Paludibacteraceae bacterium]